MKAAGISGGETERRRVQVTETREITIDELIRAGRVLFGPAFSAGSSEWRHALKAAYRRRALETHPDRARSLGRAEAELGREFRAVTDAYRILSSFRGAPSPRRAPRGSPPRPTGRRQARDAPPPWTPPRASRPPPPEPPPPPRSQGPRVRASVRPEDLPRRRLRFAEYLYYTGRVRWSELVESIAWQRAQRPPVGRIAVAYGFLDRDDVAVLLERRREAGANDVLFGEWAVRLGYLTSFQVLAALGRQRRMQRPIAQFFVERDIIEEHEIEGLRRRILRHNAGLTG